MREPKAPVPSETVIRIAGEFDPLLVRDACARALEAGGGVVLDFSHARHVEPAGLVTLARGLPRGAAGNVVVRGLNREHLRILHYLRVDPTTLGVRDEVRAPGDPDGGEEPAPGHAGRGRPAS